MEISARTDWTPIKTFALENDREPSDARELERLARSFLEALVDVVAAIAAENCVDRSPGQNRGKADAKVRFFESVRTIARAMTDLGEDQPPDLIRTQRFDAYSELHQISRYEYEKAMTADVGWNPTYTRTGTGSFPDWVAQSRRLTTMATQFEGEWQKRGLKKEVVRVRRRQAREGCLGGVAGLAITGSLALTILTAGIASPLFALACVTAGRRLVKATGQAVTSAMGFDTLADVLLRSVMFYAVSRCHPEERLIEEIETDLAAPRLSFVRLQHYAPLLSNSDLWRNAHKHRTRAQDGVATAANALLAKTIPMVINATPGTIRAQFKELRGKHILFGNFLHKRVKAFERWKVAEKKSDEEVLQAMKKKHYSADTHERVSVARALSMYARQEKWIKGFAAIIDKIEQYSTSGKTEAGVGIGVGLATLVSDLAGGEFTSAVTEHPSNVMEVMDQLKEVSGAGLETTDLAVGAREASGFDSFDPNLRSNVADVLLDADREFAGPDMSAALREVATLFERFSPVGGCRCRVSGFQ